jgi:putative transposase
MSPGGDRNAFVQDLKEVYQIAEIRGLIYTTNTIEGYNRQLRKVTKNKASFPSQEAVRKLLYLANVNIVKKWTRPISNWPKFLNQWAIRFEDHFPP